MKLVTGIIRTTSLHRIVSQLEKIGTREVTISEVKGVGEEVRLNKPYSIHDKVEVFVPDEKADEVARIIYDHAATGLAGDGLVVVSSVDYAIKIRNKERLK